MTNKITPVTKRVSSEVRAGGTGTWLGRVLDAIDRRAHIFYSAPAMIGLALLYVVPILATLYLCFHGWLFSAKRLPVWVGLANFVELFQHPRFRGAVVHTFYYAALAVSVQMFFGMVIALILNREFVGRAVVRTIFLFPMMATPVSSMLAWRLLLDPFTGVFSVIKSLGGPRVFPPLASETWVIPTLVAVDVWQYTPFVSLILLAGLSALPQEPYEAASLDGASAWDSFWYITLPLLRPVIILALLFRTIDALKAFEPIWVLTVGGPNFASETLNVYAFKEAFEYLHMGYSSALLVVYFVIILFFARLLLRARGEVL